MVVIYLIYLWFDFMLVLSLEEVLVELLGRYFCSRLVIGDAGEVEHGYGE